jgi:hypothetical protein
VKNVSILLSFFIIVISSCVYVPAGLSPSIEPLRDRNYKTTKAVQGKQTVISLFSILPFNKPDYNEAIRDALKGEPQGSSLINVRTYYRSVFLMLLSVHTLIIEGDVIQK